MNMLAPMLGYLSISSCELSNIVRKSSIVERFKVCVGQGDEDQIWKLLEGDRNWPSDLILWNDKEDMARKKEANRVGLPQKSTNWLIPTFTLIVNCSACQAVVIFRQTHCSVKESISWISAGEDNLWKLRLNNLISRLFTSGCSWYARLIAWTGFIYFLHRYFDINIQTHLNKNPARKMTMHIIQKNVLAKEYKFCLELNYYFSHLFELASCRRSGLIS